MKKKLHLKKPASKDFGQLIHAETALIVYRRPFECKDANAAWMFAAAQTPAHLRLRP